MKIIPGLVSLAVPLILALIIVSPQLAIGADTRYVSDKLIITMRSGAGGDYKILKTLHTGTPVEILEEGDKYYKVRTKDTTEGWVLKQYITAEIPKAAIISGLKKKLERSKARLKDEVAKSKARLKGEMESSKARIEKLDKEAASIRDDLKSEKILRGKDVRALEMGVNEYKDKISETTRQLKELRAKHAALVEDSADVIKVVDERDALKDRLTRVTTANDELTEENSRLLIRNIIYWFLAGGGVFLLGWLIGQISKRKRSGSFMR